MSPLRIFVARRGTDGMLELSASAESDERYRRLPLGQDEEQEQLEAQDDYLHQAGPSSQELLLTRTGRAAYERLLQAGLSHEEIEERLSGEQLEAELEEEEQEEEEEESDEEFED